MTLYFNNASLDNDWNTLGNWWEEIMGIDGGSSDVAASALPSSTDDVIILEAVIANSGSQPTVTNFEFRALGNAFFSIDITVTGLATFSGDGSTNNGTLTGDCLFLAPLSQNSGTVDGDAEFVFPANPDGTVTGTKTLTGYVLYFENATDPAVSGNWQDANWFYDAAATNPYSGDAPWLNNDPTKYCDLHRSTASDLADATVYVGLNIGSGFTIFGDCTMAMVQNDSTIYAGTFSGDNFYTTGTIYSGKFTGSSFSNAGDIYGGLFIGIDKTTVGGGVSGGSFIPNGITALFFNEVATAGAWSDVGNWFTDYEGTISANLTSAPWTVDDTTKDYWLCRSIYAEQNSTNIIISDINIGANDDSFTIGGTCTIGQTYNGSSYGYLTNQTFIYDGTFAGDGMNNDSTGNPYIFGGTFTGSYFYNYNGTIHDGTFTGSYFMNSGTINGGTFSGINFDNTSGTIYGGTFDGSNLENDINSSIHGGTFTGDYFNNYGNIYDGTFTGDYFASNGGSIYYGVFTGANSNIAFTYVYGGVFLNESIGFSSAPVYGGVFSGLSLYSDGTITGGIFSYSSFSVSTFQSGFWLESGQLDVSYVYSDITRVISGQYITPLSSMLSLNIPGQDVIGAGLL